MPWANSTISFLVLVPPIALSPAVQIVESSYKPAILENGIKIQVPPFIDSGDEILVDTRTIEYIKKL